MDERETGWAAICFPSFSTTREIPLNPVGMDFSNHGGADNISSGGGNDRIDVADGSGDDVVDCGETLGNSLDNDTVFFDSGDQIAADCESHNPF